MMKKWTENGFTLMELMVVIAIVGILAMIAIPNFIGWLPERTLDLAAQDILQGLQRSRSKAIMHNRPVVVDFDGAAESFTAFVDEDASGGLDAGEPTIVNLAMPSGIDLTPNLGGATTVIFDNRGIPDISGGVTVQNINGNNRNVQLFLSGHSVIVMP